MKNIPLERTKIMSKVQILDRISRILYHLEGINNIQLSSFENKLQKYLESMFPSDNQIKLIFDSDSIIEKSKEMMNIPLEDNNQKVLSSLLELYLLYLHFANISHTFELKLKENGDIKYFKIYIENGGILKDKIIDLSEICLCQNLRRNYSGSVCDFLRGVSKDYININDNLIYMRDLNLYLTYEKTENHLKIIEISLYEPENKVNWT